MKKILLGLIFVLPFLAMAQSPVYGVSPFDGNLKTIDTTTYAETSITMTSSLGTVTGANGLASATCGDIYIVYKIGSARRLGTVDVTTGVISDRGSLADNVASIAFDNTGALYGVTGDGALVSETFYKIDANTGAMTFIAALGNGDDGESIAFCSDNNKMYHWSGWIPSHMETIDVNTGATTTITTSVTGLDNVGGSTYLGNGKFIVGDIAAGNVKIVDTNGVAVTTPNANDFKGFAFYSGIPLPTVNIVNITNTTDSICTGDSLTLVCTYASSSYEWFLNGVSTGNTNDTITVGAAGSYTCQISDVTCGLINSNSITVAVVSAPSVQIVPTGNQQFCPGDSLQLFSSPGGAVTNQWYKDGIIISGAINVSYYVSTPGVYNVIKTNATGCTDSAAVGVTITSATSPNVVLTPSPSAILCAGGSVALSVNNGGGAIQWTKNGVNIPFETGNNYTATTTGVYNVIKTNTSQCSDSSAVGTTITQGTTPNVTITPSPSVTFCSPATVTLTANAGGGSGQWYQDGVLIPGATGNTYTAATQGSYNFLKTNISGCSDSAAVATFADDTCALSLNELNESLKFELFPNPTSGMVTIDYGQINKEEIISFGVYSIEGKLIQKIAIDALGKTNNTLDLSQVQNGTYLVRIETTQGTAVKELIVQ